ncbi:MAG TPA: cation:proton antiporter [Pirellulaceae bacterium]|nr:cation:proton antiporter [Pirellulaceae bacterium]
MPESHQVLLPLAAIFIIGALCQWLAWWVRLPSILLLLIAGIAAGPLTGLINPDSLFGEALFPIASLCVAIILFEGALELKIADLKESGATLRGLLSVGVILTWLMASAAAAMLLSMPPRIALVLGAILVVTGPTVIGPLLRDIRPVGAASAVAKWEGIIIDPIGAVLALLVFEATRVAYEAGWSHALSETGKSLLITVGVGTALGAVAALLAAWLLSRFAIPDHLQNAVVIMAVFTAFVGANLIQEESGLLAVTVMGLVLANQRLASIPHIVEFQENLRVVLISGLFVILAARLPLAELRAVGWGNVAFVAGLMFVVRPLAVWISTIGAGLTWRERAFLSWFAPRGIVAASVSSIFALRLGEAGQDLVKNTFLVIVATVAVYGLTAGPLARWLGLADADAQGVLIVGANRVARALAKALAGVGIRVLLVDSNYRLVRDSRLEGFDCQHTNILSEYALEHLDLGGMGRLLALTPNDEVNSLAAFHFRDVFGRKNVYQLPINLEQGQKLQTARDSIYGRIAVSDRATYGALEQALASGAVIKTTPLTDEFTLDDFRQRYGEEAIPLVAVSDKGRLRIFTPGDKPGKLSGYRLISLIPPGGSGASAASAKISLAETEGQD